MLTNLQIQTFVDEKENFLLYDEWDNPIGFDEEYHNKWLSITTMTEEEKALCEMYGELLLTLHNIR